MSEDSIKNQQYFDVQQLMNVTIRPFSNPSKVITSRKHDNVNNFVMLMVTKAESERNTKIEPFEKNSYLFTMSGGMIKRFNFKCFEIVGGEDLVHVPLMYEKYLNVKN